MKLRITHKTGLALAIACIALPGIADAQTKYQYNIVSAVRNDQRVVTVVFSVTDPSNNNAPYDIKTHPAFTETASGASRVFIQIGWDTRDYTNTGSGSEIGPAGAGAALPIGINALGASLSNGNGTYTVTSRPLPPEATGTGVVAIEGHPAELDPATGTLVRVPVKSVYKFFAITGNAVVPRRQVVDVANCKSCHGTLTLHGNNRTDEPQVCVICHNPNATDIPFRTAAQGPESPIDFKYLVHAIHGSKKRRTPYVVIGRGGTAHDFSEVRFPAELKYCRTCHIRGTNGLPLSSNLGTTVNTQSVLTETSKVVNGDPADDFKMTPTAAVCSSCHDSSGTRKHMERNGASFSTLQHLIASGAVRERCVDCHGAGKKKDVVRVHN